MIQLRWCVPIFVCLVVLTGCGNQLSTAPEAVSTSDPLGETMPQELGPISTIEFPYGIRASYVLPGSTPDYQDCTYETCSGDGGGTPPPGYKLPGLTMNACRTVGVSGIDADWDQLDDECEWQIASAFAPSLRFSSGEDLDSRESYWMAHAKYACTSAYTGDTIHYTCVEWRWVIRVAYLLGYHDDVEHIGDSEFLIVDIAYVEGADSWRSSRMFTSAHYGTGGDLSGWSYHNQVLEYPGIFMTYPRSWVSIGKHANYPTKDGCNTNTPFYYDNCYTNGWSERVSVRRQDNIGELENQLILVVSSRSGFPGDECFWCYGYFDGWYSSSDDITPSYRYALEARMGSPNTTDYSLIN